MQEKLQQRLSEQKNIIMEISVLSLKKINDKVKVYNFASFNIF